MARIILPLLIVLLAVHVVSAQQPPLYFEAVLGDHIDVTARRDAVDTMYQSNPENECIATWNADKILIDADLASARLHISAAAPISPMLPTHTLLLKSAQALIDSAEDRIAYHGG